MPLIHFQERFAASVETGVKRQTIRKRRKRPIKSGDRLIFGTWEGKPYRSNVRRLGEAMCMAVYDVVIGAGSWAGQIVIDGRTLGYTERRLFAQRDGFASPLELFAWFDAVHGLPFHGVLIKW